MSNHACCLGRSRPKQKQLCGAHALAQLDQKRPPNSVSAGLGPRAAMQTLDLKLTSASDRVKWLEESRMDAILGACSRSHKSVRSGIRCWMAFVGKCCCRSVLQVQSLAVPDRYDPVLKRYFPPPLHLLLSWTTMFRLGQTLRNYLGYVQTGCLMVDAPTQVGSGACMSGTSDYMCLNAGVPGTGAEESQGISGCRRQLSAT